MKRLGERAVVIGGSVAGVLAARVLADRYEQVTVIERDALPEAYEHRRAVPQGLHGHALLARGLEVLEGLLPGIGEEMVEDGAPTLIAFNDIHAAGLGASLRRSGPRPLPGPLVDRMFEDLDSDTRRAILRLYRSTDDPAGEAPRLVEALRVLDRPALVIWGESDPYLPVSLAQHQLQAFPSADVHMLEDSGHWPFVDRSERTEELLVEHLRQVAAPAEEPSRQGGLAAEVGAPHAA